MGVDYKRRCHDVVYAGSVIWVELKHRVDEVVEFLRVARVDWFQDRVSLHDL